MRINDLLGLLTELGIEDLYDDGTEIHGRCFEHENRTGSRENRSSHWSMNKETQQHFCFSCGWKGGLTSLVMDVKGLNVWDASRFARQHGVDISSLLPDRPMPYLAPVVPKVRDLELEFIQFPRPPARALKRRGISELSADLFDLRWDPERSAWLIPIADVDGALLGWQAKGSDFFLNFPRKIKKSKTLFGLGTDIEMTSVILVESPLDVVWLFECRYYAVSSFGVLVSNTQLKLLVEHADQLILALDNDEAGIAQTRAILDQGWGKRFRNGVKVFNYGDASGKDPGEMTKDEIRCGIRDSKLGVLWKHQVLDRSSEERIKT